MHLIVDAYCENIGLMTSRSRMRNWLKTLTLKAGMHTADEPYIKGYEWPGGSDHDALTCFQPLMESGISVHCYPEKKFIFLDIFSCKEFDIDKVLEFIKTSMKVYKGKVVLMNRGLDATDNAIIPATILLEWNLEE